MVALRGERLPHGVVGVTPIKSPADEVIRPGLEENAQWLVRRRVRNGRLGIVRAPVGEVRRGSLQGHEAPRYGQEAAVRFGMKPPHGERGRSTRAPPIGAAPFWILGRVQ